MESEKVKRKPFQSKKTSLCILSPTTPKQSLEITHRKTNTNKTTSYNHKESHSKEHFNSKLQNILQRYEQTNKVKKHQASTNIFVTKKPQEPTIKLKGKENTNNILKQTQEFPRLYETNNEQSRNNHKKKDIKATETTTTYSKNNNIINIINQVNEVSQDDNSNNQTIDLKMNINKYNIKCFVSSDAKLQHMLDELEFQNENENNQKYDYTHKTQPFRSKNNTLFLRPKMVNDNELLSKKIIKETKKAFKKTKSSNCLTNKNEEDESDCNDIHNINNYCYLEDKNPKSILKKSKQINNNKMINDDYSNSYSINDNNGYSSLSERNSYCNEIKSIEGYDNGKSYIEQEFFHSNNYNNDDSSKENSSIEKNTIRRRNTILNMKQNIKNDSLKKKNIGILKFNDQSDEEKKLKEETSGFENDQNKPSSNRQYIRRKTMSVIPKKCFLFNKENYNESKGNISIEKDRSKDKKKQLLIRTPSLTPKPKIIADLFETNKPYTGSTQHNQRNSICSNRSITLNNHLQLNTSDIITGEKNRSKSNTTLNLFMKKRNSINIILPSIKKVEKQKEQKMIVNSTQEGISARELFTSKIAELCTKKDSRSKSPSQSQLKNKDQVIAQTFFKQSNRTLGSIRRSNIIIQPNPLALTIDEAFINRINKKRHTNKPVQFNKSKTTLNFLFDDKSIKDLPNNQLTKTQTMTPQTNSQDISTRHNTIFSRRSKRSCKPKQQKTMPIKIPPTIALEDSINSNNDDESDIDTDEVDCLIKPKSNQNVDNNNLIQDNNNNPKLRKSLLLKKHKKHKTHIQFQVDERPSSQFPKSKRNYERNETLLEMPSILYKSTQPLHYNQINIDERYTDNESSLSQRESIQIVTNIMKKIQFIENNEKQLNASISYEDIDLNSSSYISSMKYVHIQENKLQEITSKIEKSIDSEKKLLVMKSYQHMDSFIFNTNHEDSNIDYMTQMGFKNDKSESDTIDLFFNNDYLHHTELYQSIINKKVKERFLEEYFNAVEDIYNYLFRKPRRRFNKSSKTVKKSSNLNIFRQFTHYIYNQIEEPTLKYINNYLCQDQEIELMKSTSNTFTIDLIKKFERSNEPNNTFTKKNSIKQTCKVNKIKYFRRTSLENGDSCKTKKGGIKEFSIIKQINFRNKDLKKKRNQNDSHHVRITPKYKGSLFSSQNKDITAIRTNEIKYTYTQSLGDDLHSRIAFYIKDLNFIKLNDVIKKSFGKVDINYQDDSGNTFLILAVRSNCYEMCKYLLDKGANPNFGNNEQLSPLHFALNMKNFDIVNLLLERGASETVKGSNGLTPWQCLENHL